MDDEMEYLQPGFDPKSLTVPVLRNIFIKHEIDFPSASKKADLVRIFNNELVPQATTILTEYDKIKPSSRGIINAAEYGSIGEPVAESPRKRTTRRSARESVTTTDDEDRTTADEGISADIRASLGASTRKKRNTSPVKRTRKITPLPKEDSSPEPEPVVIEATPRPKKTRMSLAATPQLSSEPETPKVRVEAPSQEEPKQEVDDEPAFSSYNPFQRGSPRSPGVDKDRRKTLPANTDSVRKSTSGSSRRKTDIMPSMKTPEPVVVVGPSSPIPASSPPRASKVISVPIEKFRALSPETRVANDYIQHQEKAIERLAPMSQETDYGTEPEFELSQDQDLNPGEEFVPEEMDEVLQADARAQHLAMGKIARRRSRPAESQHTSGNILWALLATLIAGYFAWWRKEKLEIGYCGIGRADDLTRVDHPDWTTVLRPQCEPCPPHAICYINLETKCEPDYELVTNPLSLGGLVPLAPSCQPDSERLQGITTLTNEAVKTLRNRAAEVECGEVKLQADENEGIRELDLKEEFYKRRAVSDQQFNDLWHHALAELEQKEEVVVSHDR